MANPPPSFLSSPIFPAVETNTLPQDLLLEILPRLPVKSLVRFRAVHPSWRSLFRNPNFISAHFRHSNLRSPRKALLKVRLPKSRKDAAFFLSGDTLHAVDISEISNLVGQGMYLLGSCNGVFCVTDKEKDKFLLWNPATREIMVLPPPLLPSTDQRFCVAVGFGLDTQGGGLKIIKLLLCYEKDKRYYRAEVYSLKSRLWREIQVDLEYGELMYEDNDTYCNGSYYWMSWGRNMLSFDMSREVFEWSKLPRDIRGWTICAGFDGCLLGMNPTDTSTEVWSMVGAKDWKPVKGFEHYSEFLMPVYMDYDEVVFYLRRKLWFYNSTKQEGREVWVPEEYFVHQLLPYAESLVTIENSIL